MVSLAADGPQLKQKNCDKIFMKELEMKKLLTICVVVGLSLAVSGAAQAGIFGVNMDNQKIVYLDPVTGTVGLSYDVPDKSSSQTSHDDIGLAGSQSGELYYCNGDLDAGTVYLLDASDGSLNSTVTLNGGWNVNGLGYESTATALFTSGCGVLDMHKYPATGGDPTFYWGMVDVDNAVGSDDYGRVFAAELATGNIVEVSPITSTYVNTLVLDLNGDIVGMAYDGINLYASTTAGMLYTLHPDTGAVLHEVNLGYTLDALAAAPATIEVEIDIKPGSDPNSINLCSNGAVPVAILGSDTLDVNDIDSDTLRLAEATVKVVGKKDPQTLCSVEDVNGDGYDDLVCHFITTELASVLDGTSTSATVTGELFNGIQIQGSDSIIIVKDECL